jgi:hypothetical protein
MYKDKDKQRQADRERQRRRRDKIKAKGVTDKAPGQYEVDTTVESIMPDDYPAKPANFGQSDCECRHCQNNLPIPYSGTDSRHIINHGPYKTIDELASNELNRVALPGDVGYVGQPGSIEL